MKLKKWDNKSIKVILFISIFILLSLGIAYASGAFLGGSNQASLTKGLVGHWKLDEESIIDFTINEYSYPTFDTSNSNGGWSHWGRSGAIGSYSQNTNKDYIFDKSNTYSHRVSNGPSATGEYLLYQSPSIEGITNRSLSAIVKLSDGSQVTNDKIFPAWNAITSGSIPNYIWTSIDYLGNGFYLCKAEGIKQDGSNDLVGIYVSPGIEAYFSHVQLEQKLYSSSFVIGARNGTVDDRSGYSNKGINYGAILTNGIKGESKGALEFDGVDDYINLRLKQSGENNSYAISMWIKVNQGHSNPSLILYAGGTGRLWVRQDPNSITLNSYFGSGYDYWGSSVSTPKEEWFHIVGIFDKQGNQSIYLNGELKTSRDLSSSSHLPWDTGTFYLARNSGSYYNYFNGAISDVRIYDRALSEEEIKLLYDSYKPQTTISSLTRGLILDMPLTSIWTKSENTGSERITDKTPYSNDGQNYGATLTTEGTYFSSSQNQYIQTKLKIQDYFNNSDEFTLSFWTKLTATSTVRSGLVNANKYYTEGTAGGFGVMLDQNNKFAPHIGNDLSTSSLSSLTVPINEWQHVLIKYENSNFSFYQNGILIDSLYRNNWLVNNQDILIGKGSQGGWTSTSDALIQNVRVYNRALSSEEIKLLYDSYKPQTTVASLNKGLVLDMPLTSTWTKSETPGSEIITDKTPYSNNGQNYGTVLSGEGATFDGSNDYIVTGWGQGLNPSTNPLTITMWVKPNNINSATMFFSNRQSGGSSNRLYISIYNGKWDLGIHTTTWGSGTINANTDWNFISVVMDGSQATMKANLQTTRTISYGSYNLNLNAHLGTHDLNYWYNGLIKNVRIYNRALSDEEIKLLYDQGKT